MDKKAIKFFEDNGVLMTYLLDPRKQPTELSDAQVKAGAESYWRKIMSEEIKARPNQYAAGAWEEAKTAKYTRFLRDNEILEHHKKIVEALNITITRLKRERYFWLVLGMCWGAFVMYLSRSLICQ